MREHAPKLRSEPLFALHVRFPYSTFSRHTWINTKKEQRHVHKLMLAVCLFCRFEEYIFRVMYIWNVCNITLYLNLERKQLPTTTTPIRSVIQKWIYKTSSESTQLHYNYMQCFWLVDLLQAYSTDTLHKTDNVTIGLWIASYNISVPSSLRSSL